jgi:hypothetical protein
MSNPNEPRRKQGGKAAPVGFGLILATQILAGCSGVVSSDPWFAAADAAGAPRLREGVWRLESDPANACNVHENRPLETWPSCASGMVVRPFDLLGLSKSAGGWKWDTAPYLIAAGAPPVMQLADSEPASASYEYLWVRPVRFDDQNRAVAIRGWRVLCGPPAPSPPPAGAKPTFYPGLTVASGGCAADSVGSLRAAAKSTETDYATDVFEAHWVRDGNR